MERDLLNGINILHPQYFNSHAHVERDYVKSGGQKGILISTHTLTWSVTYAKALTVSTEYISTHTLTWSVTTSGQGLPDGCPNFNSHAHVERDSNSHGHFH